MLLHPIGSLARSRLFLAAVFLAFVGCVVFGTIQWGNRLQATVSHKKLLVEDLEREYRLVIPHQTVGKSNLPLVIALHGALDTTDEMASYTGLDELSAEKGFKLIYLQGRLLNWPPSIVPENPNHIVPDLQFLDAICDESVANLGVDRSRIYLVGVSQGGGMCNLLVAKRSERIAAAVCNCGWLPAPLGETPLETKHKTPMLFLVGSEDRQVSPETVKKAHDAFKEAGHLVELRVLNAAGHGWNKQLGINESIWRFLSQHQLLKP